VLDERGVWWRWSAETGHWQSWSRMWRPGERGEQAFYWGWLDSIGPVPRASDNLARLVEIAALGEEGGAYSTSWTKPEEHLRWTGGRWERRTADGEWVAASLSGSPKHYAALLALLPRDTVVSSPQDKTP
jgi:hypothetical protein